MKTLIFCLCALGANGQNFYWCSEYNSLDYVGKLPTVIAIQGDSVQTYVYDAKYLWWKIQSGNYRVIKDTNLIESAELFLANEFGKSYLVIKPSVAMQIITVVMVQEPDPNIESLDQMRKVTALTYSIEFKPNKKKMR